MRKNKIKLFIFILIVCIIIFSTIIYFLNKSRNKENNIIGINPNIDYTVQKNIEEDVIIEKLSKMSEIDRIKYYVSKFFNALEKERYEKAYDMLYSGFKENYFPNFSNFENYIKGKFPKMVSVDYLNIEKSGDIYILFTEITDVFLGDKIEIDKVIIKEEKLGEFVVSFSFM